MNYIIIGIFGILIVNFLLSKTYLLKKALLKRNRNLKPLDDKYVSILDNFKKKLNVNLKSYLLFNPDALEENCRVQILKNEIYIIVDKNINEERLKGSIAHELGHVKMEHKEKSERYIQNLMFLINLVFVSLLLYPILNFEAFCIIFLIAFEIYTSYYMFYQHIIRKQELEADNVAVKLMGEEYIESLNATKRLISKVPSFLSDHPSTKARLKNARKTYEAYYK